MEQVLINGHQGNVFQDVPAYCGIYANSDWQMTENLREQCIPISGAISDLRIETNFAPGAGTSYVFTLRVNGAPSALTVTIANAATSGQDIVNSVNVVAGDIVCLQSQPVGGFPPFPAAVVPHWTLKWTAGVKESIVLGSCHTSVSGTVYAPISHNDEVNGTELESRQVIPTDGNLKCLFIDQDVAAGGGGYIYTLRLNGADTALTVTINDPNTTGNDVAHSVAVVAGDVVAMSMVRIAGMLVDPIVHYGMVFEPDIDGESLILGGTWNPLHDTNTEYNYLGMGWLGDSWTVTEASRDEMGQECTLKKLFMLLSAAPGAGNSYQFIGEIKCR